jgi:hypothetical protein
VDRFNATRSLIGIDSRRLRYTITPLMCAQTVVATLDTLPVSAMHLLYIAYTYSNEIPDLQLLRHIEALYAQRIVLLHHSMN